MSNFNIEIDGKKAKNSEIFELLEIGYEQAVKWTESKENEKPHELVTMLLNLINAALKQTSETHEIEYIFEMIAMYLDVFRFGEKKRRTIFEKTMASLSEAFKNEGGVNALSVFRILLDHTSKLVK